MIETLNGIEMMSLLQVLMDDGNTLNDKFRKLQKKASCKQRQTVKLMFDTVKVCYKLTSINKMILSITTSMNENGDFDEEIALAKGNLKIFQEIIGFYEEAMDEIDKEIGEVN